MTDQTPPDPSGQPPPPPPGYPPQGCPPQGYQQPEPGYGQQYPGYPPQPRKPLDLARLGDRLFSGLVNLATGIFYAGVLLAVSVWLGNQKAND